MRHPYSTSENEMKDYTDARSRLLVEETLRGNYALALRMLSEGSLPEKSRLEQLSETYRLLCSYYARGAEDPSRDEILRKIGRELMALIRREREINVRLPYSCIAARERLGEGYDFAEDLGRPLMRREPGYFDRLDRLFDYLWVTDRLTEADCEAIRRSTDKVERRIILSGLFVGLCEEFDPAKVLLLIEVLEDREPADVAIALPALLMGGRRHQSEIVRLYPELAERGLAALRRLREELHMAVEELYNTYSTERNDRIFTEEVLPKLQGLGEHLRGMPGATMEDQVQNFYHSLDEHQDDQIESLLADAMGRLGDMQKDRFDMEYSSVKNLKVFPFFSSPAHWFYPYIPTHPDLIEGNVRMLADWGTALFGGRRLVSSDRYSFSLIPGLDRMIPQMDLPGGVSLGESEPMTLREQMRDFLFGAYRFYTLYSDASDFISPFEGHPFVLDGPFTRAADLYTEDQLCDLALRVAHDGHYGSAGRLYERSQRDYGSHSGEVWRGIAVVCMMDDRDEEALHALEEAIREEGMRSGTAERVVSLLVKLGRKSDAIDFIRQAEDQVEGPGRVRLVAERVRLLRERGEPEETLQAAYKADFLADGEDKEISETLCALLLESGQEAEAVKRAHSSSLPLYEGVARIATGERTEGIALLSNALRRGEIGPDRLREPLALLGKYDIPDWERALIYDTIILQSYEAK
ncbi:hypothetical protein [uncultured Porphyromonas sp.]|uniref:tetratricopeptide repeat protein n=1 Tax=uncultured Porphyromonas sp. TaxID=159274 RepID=UPI00259812C6|nr:hypothetical protein [uncultured Porphyromonas sp.]